MMYAILFLFYGTAIAIDFIPQIKRGEKRKLIIYIVMAVLSLAALVLYIAGAPVSGLLGLLER